MHMEGEEVPSGAFSLFLSALKVKPTAALYWRVLEATGRTRKGPIRRTTEIA